MINQEIKSKARAKKLSDVLAMDVMYMLECFGCYTTDIIVSEYDYEVVIYSGCSCAIITQPVMERIFKVIETYEMQYANINHHLDTYSYDGRKVPAIVVCVTWTRLK